MTAKPSGRIYTCVTCGEKAVWGEGWTHLFAHRWSITCSTACEDAMYDRWDRGDISSPGGLTPLTAEEEAAG